jgi:hypothetical protein
MTDPRKEKDKRKQEERERHVPSEDIDMGRDMGRMPGSESTGNTGSRSRLQPGGTKPAGGHHPMGEIGTGGGGTGPRSDRDGSHREPEDE